MADAPNGNAASSGTTSGTGSPAGSATATAGAAAAAAPAPTTSSATASPAATTALPAPGDGAASAAPAADSAKSSLLGDTGQSKSPAGEQKGQQTEGAPAKDASAPAPYDFQLPEGFQISDQAQFDAAKKFMQESGVPIDKAPQAIEWLATQQQAVKEAVSADNKKVWDDTNAGWQKDNFKNFNVTNAEEFKATESYKNFSNALEEFGKDIPGLKAALDYTGAGNHPDIVKFVFRMADALKEGNFAVQGKNANTGKGKSKASRLYD